MQTLSNQIVEAAQSSPAATGLAAILAQPAVIGAMIAGLIAGVGIVTNFLLGHQLQKQRLVHEQALADRRFERDVELTKHKHKLDMQLSDRRLSADTQLAERKHQLDRSMEQWRRRLGWVEDTLADFYNAANIVAFVRFPGAFNTEAEAREGREREPADLQRWRDMYYPVLKRLQENSEALSALYSKRFRAIAMFGPGADEPFNRLHAVVTQITVGAQTLMRANTHSGVGTMPAFKDKMEKRVWEGLEESDPIVVETQAILAKVDELFGTVLNEKQPQAAVAE